METNAELNTQTKDNSVEFIDYEDCDININDNFAQSEIEVKMEDDKPKNWFEKLFNFYESNSNDQNAEKIKQLHIKENNIWKIKNVPVGVFSIVKNSDLAQKFGKIKTAKPVVTLENIVMDLKDLYSNPELCNNAIIQVETLCNYLGNDKQKLEDYPNHHFSYLSYTPTGLAYRNYIKPNENNMFFSFFDYLETINPNINHTIKDGYLHFEHDNEIKKINRILSPDMNRRRDIRKTIMSGLHKNQGVVINGKQQNHTVTNIFNCGIPINKNDFGSDLWKGIIELYLEGVYENALFLAHQNNVENKNIGTCYLGLIGKELGANTQQIERAIQRACHIMAKNGFKLNVKIIHHKNIDNAFVHMPKQYPLDIVHVNSVWDNNAWVNASV
jgi:hypothetical protein